MTTLTVSAQSFSIDISFDNPQRGIVTLNIYDGDTIPRQMRKKVTKGVTTFMGQVERPCYAEVITANGKRYGLFMENSFIAVHINETNLESSVVKGSLTNSQYRYTLELCRLPDGNYDTKKLIAKVEENKSAVFAPLLIYEYIMPRCELSVVNQLAGILDGDAKAAYHYRLLKNRISTINYQMSNKIPDIEFADAKGGKHHTDSLFVDSCYNLILVGASWCKQCRNAESEARHQNQNLNIIKIDIDNDQKQWDAEVINKLQIDHLPFLILVDKNRKIVARDIRAWDIKRTMLLGNL